MSEAPLLTVEHLTMRFGGLVAVDDVSLIAGDREITGVIGPNGAGKTTVFNCLTGFYKPTIGRLALNGARGQFLLEQMDGYLIAQRAGVARTFQNIRLFAGDATELLAWAPPHSLQRIDLIHPDPWPKRRHWKRRFVQDATVAAIARALVPNGEFRFVSDIDDYCAWTLAHLARSPDFAWTAERAADWRLPWADYTMTRYGAKAEREGRQAAYLRFRRMS